MQTKVQNMQNYIGYTKCGEILKPPEESYHRPFVLKCFHCKEIYLLFEAFIYHIEDHCKDSLSRNMTFTTNTLENDNASQDDFTPMDKQIGCPDGIEITDETIKLEPIVSVMETVDPLTVIENKYIFEDECSNVKKVNEEHIVHSDNSDSSATVYELDIISDVESENKYDEEVSDSDSDIEKTVKKEDTGKNKDVSEFMKSKQNVKLLISAYRNKPFLWNKNSALLKNKPERQKCLEQIAEELKEQCSSDINWKLVANTIKILCKNYRADIKSAKEKESCKGNVKYIPSWYFNDLHFLRPFVENSLISKLDLHLPDLSRNQIIQILELYKGYPHLWNTHIIEYYCKNKRSAAKLGMLESMETSMGIQISELTLEYYFRTIHNFFTQAKSKKLDSKKGGEEAASKLNNQHVYYEKLIFLYDHVGKFKCSECPRTCKTSIYLKLHKTQLHGSDPLVCTLCNKEFKAANAYINHAKRHMADFHHECKECGKKFLHPSDLRIHMRNHSGVKPFCCEICGASFRHYQGFSIHRRRHKKNYLYTCNICNKGYYTKGRYNYHMNAHSYNRLQTCIVCGKTFLSKKPLKQNVVIHEGSKSSTCKQCLKQESIQHKKAKYGEKSTVNKG